jgi:ferredoxin-NADP reductase
MAVQEYLTQVTAIKHLTLDVIELQVQLVLPHEISYQAGQFMEFKIGTHYRCYSLVTPPVSDNPNLTFCIKLETQGVGSDYARQLKVGDEVVMRGPKGFFVVEDFGRPIFLVAGGVGIAPFAAIIPDLLARGFKPLVHLLFGVRSEENVFYFDRFNHLAKQYENFHFVPILSRPQSHWPGQTGRILTYLEIGYANHKEYQFYISGSDSLVKEVRGLLSKLGHEPKKIQTEAFIS